MEHSLKSTGVLRLGKNHAEKKATEIELKEHEVFSIPSGRDGVVVQALKGILWITRKGDYQDYILQPGEQYSTKEDGLILIEGIKSSQFKLLS